MERYAINPTKKRLHKQGCHHSKEAFASNENLSLTELLAGYDKTLQCCKVCLKNDETAQELVRQHNEQFRWHPKEKTREV